MQYGGYLWPKIKGKAFKVRYGKKVYVSDSKAKSACKDSNTCTGVTFVKANKYILGQGTTLVKAPKKAVYIQGDEIITSSSIYWIKKSGHTLTTRISNKKYTDLTSSLSACASNAACQVHIIPTIPADNCL